MFAHYPHTSTSYDQVAQLYSGLGAGLSAASVLGRTIFGSRNSGMYLRSGRVVGQRRRRAPAPFSRNVRRRTSLAQARTVRRRMPVEGRGVTNQHDRQIIYKKSRMPRRYKKSWRIFKRKVNAIAEKNLGTNTVVFNGKYTFSNSDSTLHGLAEVALYGLNSSTHAVYNDLNNISALGNPNDFTAAGGYPVDLTTKYYFQSAVLDITMRNVSEFTSTFDLNTACTLEVDLYEISVKQGSSYKTSGSITGNDFNSFSQYLKRGDGDTKVIGNAVGVGLSSIEPDKRGTTPWDHPDAISKFGIKIWKKTKFFIANGQTATYQYRDPRRHVSSHMNLVEQISCNKPRWTRHIFIVFKAVPGIVVGGAPGMTTEKLVIGATRKYMYKQEGVNQTRDVHIAQ